MCVVDKDGNYELVICDLDDSPIVSIDFASISQICRILDESDLSRCIMNVYRKHDNQKLDSELLISIWRNQ